MSHTSVGVAALQRYLFILMLSYRLCNPIPVNRILIMVHLAAAHVWLLSGEWYAEPEAKMRKKRSQMPFFGIPDCLVRA